MANLLSGLAAGADAGTMATVLVCEDDDDIVVLVADLLDTAGHEVRTVGTVREALAALDDEAPDVLVCDLGLPDGTGEQVCAAATAAGVRVVVTTAVPPVGYPDVLPTWANVVLRKPFTGAALRAAVLGDPLP